MHDQQNWKKSIIEENSKLLRGIYNSFLNNLSHPKKVKILQKELARIIDWFESNGFISKSDTSKKIWQVNKAEDLRAAIAPCLREIENIDDVKLSMIRKKDLKHGVLKHQPLRLIVLCCNIKSAHNLGNIIRTAESLGYTEIITTGYTAPLNSEKVTKTSMGSELFINWSHHETPLPIIENLKSSGYRIVCLETMESSHSIENITHPKTTKYCIIIGNETHGLPASVLNQADFIYTLPQYGKKNSLNVSNAFAAASYLLFTRK